MTVALTPQQSRTVELLAKGLNQRQIAASLGVSKYRVRTIVRRLCEIYGCQAGWEVPAVAFGGQLLDDFDDDGRIHV